jgi:hypothetical protein
MKGTILAVEPFDAETEWILTPFVSKNNNKVQLTALFLD